MKLFLTDWSIPVLLKSIADPKSFIRTIKYPSKSGKYSFIAITLDNETLQNYATENKIVADNHYQGKQKLFFEPNEFLSSYFISLNI